MEHVCFLDFPILYLIRRSVVDQISGVRESLKFGTKVPLACLILREFITLRCLIQGGGGGQ